MITLKKNYACIIMLCLTVTAFAQMGTIKGTVTNKEINNNPLPYANVFIKNTTKATQTDSKGNFEINTISVGKHTLIVSFLGYKTKELKIVITPNKTINIKIVLKKDIFGLDEVTIVSNRDKETINEIPSSVSILTNQKIKEISQSSNVIADILANIPGISLSNNTTSNRGQTLRGRKMLVMIDGIPQSTPLRNGSRDINTIDPSVIERIEVIKGATSIYGNGADGGIVNYITKSPKRDEKIISSTTIGSTGSLVNIDNTVGSSISQQLMGKLKKFSYIVNGGYKQTGVFRSAKNEILSPFYGLGETAVYNVFGKFGFNINENNKIELMTNYFSSNQNSNYKTQNGVYGVSPAIGVLGKIGGVNQGNRHNLNMQLKYNTYNLFSNTNLDVNLYYQDFKTVYGYSTYFTDKKLGFTGGQSQIKSTKKGARFNFKTVYFLGDIFSGNLVYGLDILSDNTSQSLVDGRVWVPKIKMNNMAPYLQIKTKFSNLVFKGGIRFENINLQINDYKTLYIDAYGKGTSISGGILVKGGKLKYNATVLNVGLRYNKIIIFQPFISFSQSFSISDLGRTLRTAKQNTVDKIKSEALIANNYELGFTSNFSIITLQGATFISTSKLGSTFRENPNTQEFEVVRQPEKIYGFELQLDTKLTNTLSFGASYSYVEGKYDGNNNGRYTDKEDGFLGGDRVSPSIFRTYVSYKFSTKWNARLSSILNDYRKHFEPIKGKYYYGKGPVNSFTTTNLYSSYKLTTNTTLAMGIENLFNEDYYTLPSQWGGRNSSYSKGNGIRFNISLNIEI